jgi:hypothetical protein
MAKETFSRTKPHLVYGAPPPDSFESFDITVTAGALNVVNLTFAGSGVSGYLAMAYLSTSYGSGKMTVSKSQLRLISSQAIPVTPFIQNLATKYETRFGVPSAGDKIFCHVILINTTSGTWVTMGTLSTIVLEV